MNSEVLLVCPRDGERLLHEVGCLQCPICAAVYPVRDNIARFVAVPEDKGQAQVQEAFRFKWTRDEWGYKPHHVKLMGEFFRQRFGFSSDADIEVFFGGKTILHAGIGNGQTEQFYLPYAQEVWGIDISESVDACCQNWRSYYGDLSEKLMLAQADLMEMPFEDETFDIVISDGVLHHTPNTFEALKAITRKTRKQGYVLFYVYRKKAPIREFVDDFVRQKLNQLSAEQAWHELEPLTQLAREMTKANISIRVPSEVSLLGFNKGDYDLQRWLYWHVMKFYWNDVFSFDENNHVNFDWYYPAYAWRHDPEEVADWLSKLDLEKIHFRIDNAGISVIAKRY